MVFALRDGQQASFRCLCCWIAPSFMALDDVVPHIIIQSLRLRVGEFDFHLAKRLLQQYLLTTDIRFDLH
jgi:hypothetical protein